MNHLTLMRMQSILPFFNNISLRTTTSDQSLGCLDRCEKASIHATVNTVNHQKTAEPGLMMHITIDASCVTQLRHLIMGTCGELVEFMRIQPIAHAKKMKVWLCLSKAAVALIMDAVMRCLPNAEFGRITRA
ncbi:MAG: hypothetical protein ACXU7H_10980 [Burkholderiaceae bacterium]